MEISTLPVFRIVGLSETVSRENARVFAQNLRDKYVANPPNDVVAFSPTLYCVYQYLDENQVKITLGNLSSTDTALPENCAEAWVAPQNYAVFMAENADNIPDLWQHIDQLQDLNRSFLVDLESYPKMGAPRIYVGLLGEVNISED